MSQKIGELSIILQNPSFTLNFSTLYSIFDLKIKTDPKWTQCLKNQTSPGPKIAKMEKNGPQVCKMDPIGNYCGRSYWY